MTAIDFLNKLKIEDIAFDKDELLSLIDEIKPKMTVKSQDEITAEHKMRFKNALINAQIVETQGEYGFTVIDNQFDKYEYLRDKNLKDMDKLIKEIKTACVAYCFVSGSYTPKKSWIRFADKRYVKFPDLITKGNHGVMTTVFCDQISELLETKDNALINVLTRAQVKLSTEKRLYCFPKGHFVSKNHKEAIQKDLKIIFEEMAKNAAVRNFSKLTFFDDKVIV